MEEEAAEDVRFAIDRLHQARDEIRVEEQKLSHFEGPDVPSVELENNRIEMQTARTTAQEKKKNTKLWEEAENLVGAEQYMFKLGGRILKRKINTGSWSNFFGKSGSSNTTRTVAENFIPAGCLSKITRSESYAVVTFTSRQAAIAARQCLSDGSGLDGWREVDKIPIPPLADSVPWNICDCRGCCRPVTVTLPSQERRLRFIT